MVNNYRSPISQVEENKKQYTTRDVNRADHKRLFHHITNQSVNQVLHVVDNSILQNLPIMWAYAGMDEDIYGPSMPHL